eukprot:739727-Pelagomonas_calceolata.AAC.3
MNSLIAFKWRRFKIRHAAGMQQALYAPLFTPYLLVTWVGNLRASETSYHMLHTLDTAEDGISGPIATTSKHSHFCRCIQQQHQKVSTLLSYLWNHTLQGMPTLVNYTWKHAMLPPPTVQHMPVVVGDQESYLSPPPHTPVLPGLASCSTKAIQLEAVDTIGRRQHTRTKAPGIASIKLGVCRTRVCAQDPLNLCSNIPPSAHFAHHPKQYFVLTMPVLCAGSGPFCSVFLSSSLRPNRDWKTHRRSSPVLSVSTMSAT